MTTLAGQSRRLNRAVIVLMHRGLIRPILLPVFEWLDKRPIVHRIADWPPLVWLDEHSPRWLRFGTMEFWIAAYVIWMATVLIVWIFR